MKRSIILAILMLFALVTTVSADGVLIERSEFANNYSGTAIEAYPLASGGLAYVSVSENNITLSVMGETYDESSSFIHGEYVKNILVTGCGKRIYALVNYDFSRAEYPPIGSESTIVTWILMENLATCQRSTLYMPLYIEPEPIE